MSAPRRVRAVLRHALLPVLLAAAAGGAVLAWTAGGGGTTGAAVAAAVAVVVVGEVAVSGPLRRLAAHLDRVRLTGDLATPVPVPAGPARQCARAVAGVVEAVASVMGKVFFTSTLVGSNAESLTSTAGEVTATYGRQEEAVAEAGTAVRQVLEAVESVTAEAAVAAERAAASRNLTSSGGRDVRQAREQMGSIATSVGETVGAVEALGDRIRAIDDMVAVITGIAEQTNLLALNATIESARAGESGRGFAVVAHEVGRLAETTAASTKEITEVVDGVRKDTERVLALVGRTAALADDGARLAAAATEAIDQIEDSAHATTSSVEAIIEAAGTQRRAGERLGDQMRRIGELAGTTRAAAGEVDTQAGGLEHLAANLRELERVFLLGDRGREGLDVHLRMPDVVRSAAAQVAAVLEGAVAAGRIGFEDLFDTDYRPIPGTSPQKFRTRFDALTDELLPAVQEPVLASDPHLAYAGAVDRNGYFPTHNVVFSRPLTGDPAVDLVRNRTKRIFDDPVGRRCGSHDLPFLVQTYRRDTGEVMHDISAPIVVRGRQWGGFRIGYRA